MNNYISKYESYLINKKNATKNTVSSYLRDLNQFYLFLQQRNYTSFLIIKENDIMEFINTLKENKKSNATISRCIASIRGFYQYLISSQIATENPTKDIKLEKNDKKLPMILTDKEVELLLEQPSSGDIKGIRDKAMLELLYATGIRASELVDLNVSDVNLSQGLLYCNNGKKQRIIPIYKQAVVAIENYLANVRVILSTEDSGYSLFINMNGKRLTRQGFWKIIKGYAQLASIDKEITPQVLRHSFALHLIENGANVNDVKEMMGHCDISSTYVYLDIVNDHTKDVYNSCHPRAKK